MLSLAARLASGPRSRWVVIGLWALAALALAPFHSDLQREAEDESETFLVRGSESAEVERLLDERFVLGAEVATIIVYDGPAGEHVDGLAGERIIADGEALCASEAIADLTMVITPYGLPCGDLSESIGPQTPPAPYGADGSSALTVVLTSDDDTERVVENVAAIREIVGAGPRDDDPDGLAVHVTGQGGFDADRADALSGIDRTLLAITILLILGLLVAIYRSPVVAGVPLAVVGAAYLIAAGVVWGLVEAGATTISGQTTAILIVLMFGAGTDYCLLLVARFREELRPGVEVAEAMARACERAGPVIASAGGTVVAAMLVLGLADFNATREMGPILALGVAIMVLAGLTLLPAVLAALGPRAFWPAAPGARPRAARGATGEGFWRGVAARVAARPLPIASAVAVLLAAGALGNLGGRDTLAFTDTFRDEPDSVRGQRVIEDAFPPGQGAPLELVITAVVSGEVIPPLAELDGVEAAHWSAGSGTLDPDPELPVGDLVSGEILLSVDPFSERARELVPAIREEIDGRLAEAAEAHGVPAGEAVAALGGIAARGYDANEALARDSRLIVPLALALILAVLIFLLRSLVAPLIVLVTVVLSFAFALGVGSLFFAHVLGQAGSDPNLPIFAFVFLVGLGVDYNIFLLSRVREERARGSTTHEAAVAALERTGGVITSAGLILAGTFAILMVLPLEPLFQVGFVVSLGLLVDAFLVRALLVPAIALVVGERIWWPSAPPMATLEKAASDPD